MKRLFAVFFAVTVALFFLQAVDVSAEGFSNVGFSAEAMGRADAVIASIDDAAAMWYNPAKAAWLEGHNLQVNVDNIYPFSEHTPGNTPGANKFKNELGLAQLGSLFYTYKPGFMDNKWTFGLGINTPYGLASNYPRESSVSAISYRARLTTVLYNLNAAYKITDNMAASLGLMYMTWKGSLKLIYLGTDIEFDFGSQTAQGINAAFAWKVTEKDTIGLTFRSQLKVRSDDATVTIANNGILKPVILSLYGLSLEDSAKLKTHFSYPDEYGIGWSHQFSEKLLAEVSGIFRNWNDYDFVPYVSNDNTAIGAVFFQAGAGVRNDWRNGGIIALGMKYDVSDFWGYTTGYQYHQDPENEYYAVAMMPDTPQHAISGGLNFNFGSLTLSPAFLYGTNGKKTINAPGRYKNGQNIDGDWDIQVYHFNLGASYKF